MLYTTNLNLRKPESTDTVNVEDFNGNADILDAAVQGKVDKAEGKGLSQEDYTTAEKTKLAGIAVGANQYVHPNHTGDVTSNGDGVTAIAPGVIVNADINASAAIDATKIAGGTVDNTEFGYLDGVTSPIQSQLDAKSAISDYIRQPGYAAATGSANAYAVTLSPALAAYAAGVCVAVKINVANTGASTLNVNGLGAKAILDSKGNAMTAGKLKVDSIYTLRYNGTAFIVQGEGTDEASDILGKIKTVDGAGSGLDAEYLAGKAESAYVSSSHGVAFITNADTITKEGNYPTSYTFTGSPYSGTDARNQGYLMHITWGGSSAYNMQIHTNINSPPFVRKYRMKDNNVWGAWITMWDSNNDGAGSGLDADKFQGKAPSAFGQNGFLAEGTDVNTVTQSGFYRLSGTHPNLPSGAQYGQLLVIHGSADTITQIATGYGDARMFWRSGNPSNVGGSGVWASWRIVWDDSVLRFNAGKLEMNDGTGWKPVGDRILSMTPNVINYRNGSLSLTGSASVDVFSVSGSGVLNPFDVAITQYSSSTLYSQTGVIAVIDGVEYPLYAVESTISYQPTYAGSLSVYPSGSGAPAIIQSKMTYKYNTGFKIRLKNLNTYTGSIGVSVQGGYYV